MSTLAASIRMSGPYTATAGQTVFAANFPLFIDAEGNPAGVGVVRRRGGIETTLNWPAFAVSGGPPYTSGPPTLTSFNVTIDPCVAGDIVIVFSVLPLLRDRANPPGGAIRTPTLEGDAMYLEAQHQEARRELFRSFLAPLGEGGGQMPAATLRAGKFLAFDGAGNPIAVAPITLPTANGAFNQIGTGKIDAQNGAVNNRMADTLDVGDGILNDRRYPNNAGDWLSAWEVGTGLGSPGLILFSQGSFIANAAANNGLLTGGHALHITAPGPSTFGHVSIVVMDNTTVAGLSGWAGYKEAYGVAAWTLGSLYADETDVHIARAGTSPTSYQQASDANFQFGAGAGLTAVGQYDVGATIQICDNPMKYKVAINILSTALTSAGTALSLATGHIILWNNSGGHNAGAMTSEVTGASNPLIQFTDGGLQYSANGAAVALFEGVASAVNYLAFFNAVTGGASGLAAIGADANVYLDMLGKGTSGVNLLDGAGATKIQVNTTGVGFFGHAAAAKPTIAGSKAANAALASLITGLAGLGLLIDTTT